MIKKPELPCKKCKAPKRHPGCHDSCTLYKKSHEEKKLYEKVITDAKAADRVINDYIYKRSIPKKKK